MIIRSVVNYRAADCCCVCKYSHEEDMFSGMSGTILVCEKEDGTVNPVCICDFFEENA